ncbi:hypothetical protein KB221_07450 [Aquidulcibacter paucihalophilus]|nr:hypothetical protein KB221_07450 [Aquidulcibacter paucihalophilus]
MTDHVVATTWLGCDHVLPLSPEQYQEVRRAKDLLMAGLALEESYDVFILNYTSFETGALAATVSNVVGRHQDRHEWEELRRDLDRHLVNLLASGQMYADHAGRLLKTAPRSGWRVDPQPVIDARAVLEAELPGFRAMRWLRNAALHQTLPISSWGFNSSWTDGKTGPKARRQHSYSAAFDIQLIATARGLPPSLRDVLIARADRKGLIQWRPLVREYVEGTSKLNEAMRKALKAGEAAASALLDDLVTRYREPFGGEKPISVVAVCRTADGRWLEFSALDFDYPQRINPLRRKNRALTNLRDLEIVS